MPEILIGRYLYTYQCDNCNKCLDHYDPATTIPEIDCTGHEATHWIRNDLCKFCCIVPCGCDEMLNKRKDLKDWEE